MARNSALPNRQSIRLRGYDYSSEGAYFVTTCTQERLCLFAETVNRKLLLNPAGEMVHDVWESLPGRFPGMLLDAFVVMPNHVHAVLILTSMIEPGPSQGPPHPSRQNRPAAPSLGQ